MIDPGELRHKVAIERKVRSGTGPRGESVFAFQEQYTRWAKIEPLGGASAGGRFSGREVEISRQLVATATHRITLRFCDLTTRDRLRYKGRTFNVNDAADVLERGEWLVLTCTEEK